MLSTQDEFLNSFIKRRMLRQYWRTFSIKYYECIIFHCRYKVTSYVCIYRQCIYTLSDYICISNQIQEDSNKKVSYVEAEDQ